MTLRDRIEAEVAGYARLGHPALMQRFILRRGILSPGAPLPPGVGRGQKKSCFKNAARLSQSDLSLTYVEGYVHTDLPILIHHAWCVTGDGTVIDTTLDDPEDAHYFGVPFTFGQLAYEMNRTGVYGLLDTGSGVNHDMIFRLDPELKQIVEEIRRARPADVLL